MLFILDKLTCIAGTRRSTMDEITTLYALEVPKPVI